MTNIETIDMANRSELARILARRGWCDSCLLGFCDTKECFNHIETWMGMECEDNPPAENVAEPQQEAPAVRNPDKTMIKCGRMNKYAKYIRSKLSNQELLEQLAEECNELAKASLKMIRAGGMSANITPITRREAYDNFVEEQKDVVSVLWLLTRDERYAYIAGYPKYERWAKRLGYEEE